MDVAAGNSKTNLRQILQQRMATRGLQCRCIRCREVKNLVCTRPGPPRKRYMCATCEMNALKGTRQQPALDERLDGGHDRAGTRVLASADVAIVSVGG